MKTSRRPLEDRDIVQWDELYSRRRPRGPGVLLFSPDHVVIGLPPSTDRRLKSNTVSLSDCDEEPYTLFEVSRNFEIRRIYGWIVDLNERGYFSAHVEDAGGNVVFSCSNDEQDEEGHVEYGELWLTRDGFMRHADDTSGLTSYLRSLNVIGPLDSIWPERQFREHIRSLEERHQRPARRYRTSELAQPA